jgi:cellulose synthase/poly-beta-1,6-N-acetylglucosamine synthase-like glycosyltransferase
MIREMQREHPGLRLRHLQAVGTVVSEKRNLGLREAAGEIVVFLDDDCVPARDLVGRYRELLADAPPRTVFCGEVEFPAEWVARSNYVRFRDENHFRFGSPRHPRPKDLDFRQIVTMNMGLRKAEVLAAVGEFDERFVGYGLEDVEYGWRLQRAGFRIAPCNARILHLETSTTLSRYRTKLHRAARDGMRMLLEIRPEAARSLLTYRLEPTAPPSLKWRAIRALLRSPLPGLAERFLALVDGRRSLYFPRLYRLVMAQAVLDGIDERPEVPLTRDDVRKGWYEDVAG